MQGMCLHSHLKQVALTRGHGRCDALVLLSKAPMQVPYATPCTAEYGRLKANISIQALSASRKHMPQQSCQRWQGPRQYWICTHHCQQQMQRLLGMISGLVE